MYRVLTGLVVFAVAGCCQESTFRTQSPLVVVPVTVCDKQGAQILGLAENDFILYDNNQPRTVHVDPWGAYQTNISLVIVVQSSGMSEAALQKVRKTGSLIEAYITGEGGEAAVISANDEIRTVQEFTKDGDTVRETFERLKSNGEQGRVLDGVNMALEMLAEKPKTQRRLILVISETRDRGSKAKVTDILGTAQRENATIYTATYSAYLTPFTTKASVPTDDGPSGLSLAQDQVGGMNLLAIFSEIAHQASRNVGDALAEYTGGRHVGFATLKGLENDLARVGQEVHSQYMLSFTPPAEKDATFHEISVKIKDRDYVVVRTRRGYWNTSPSGRQQP